MLCFRSFRFRSYRSTSAISAFTQRIVRNPDLIAMERKGPEPVMSAFDDDVAEVEGIKHVIAAFRASEHHSLAIITKTHHQSKFLFRKLKDLGVNLLTPESTSLKSGVILTTAHLAKGLEFD